MPIRAISNIEPYNNSPFPVTEDVYVKGGYRVVGRAVEVETVFIDYLLQITKGF